MPFANATVLLLYTAADEDEANITLLFVFCFECFFGDEWVWFCVEVGVVHGGGTEMGVTVAGRYGGLVSEDSEVEPCNNEEDCYVQS